MIFFFPSIKYFLLRQAGGSDEGRPLTPPSRGEALRRSSLFNRAANAILKGSVKAMLNVVSYVNTA
jgi:hypothetical protein